MKVDQSLPIIQQEVKAISMPKLLSKDQLSVESYLNEINFTRVESEFSDQLLMNGKIVTQSGKVFNTLIELPQKIISYPKIYSIDCDLAYYFPHIELPRKCNLGTLSGMCYIKENEKLYSNNPKEIVHKALKKYIDLCEDITNNRFDNRANEFLDEFDSYWPAFYSTFYLYLKSNLRDKQKVEISMLQDTGKNIQQLILHDDADAIKKYAVSSNMSISNYNSIYIDIGNNFSIPFPYRIKDLVKLFKASGHLPYLKNQLKKNVVFNAFFIGFFLPNGEKHYAAISIHRDKYKNLNMSKNGYQIFFSKTLENEQFYGSHIKSINKRWLMQRGGDNTTHQVSNQSYTIAILGCGSIGSNLAYKLCKCGFSNIILIDPYRLESSNIARHFLGMSSVGELKAEAMTKALNAQFVGMNVISYTKLAEDCIYELYNVDLIIGAIGSDAPAVETYISELIIHKELPSMVSCWLEANAIAGHAFHIDSSINLSSFDDATEKLNILDYEFASTLIQSEVGCNSDYMPYSHFEADNHINKMVQFIVDISLKKNNLRAMSSYGNIIQYKDNLTYSAHPYSVYHWSDHEI